MLPSLALSAFALSLMGAAHCAAMCGGFVASAHARVATPSETPRARPFAMHAGRIASYAFIGAVLGAVGALPLAWTASPAVHRFVFLVACVALAWSGLRLAGLHFPPAVGASALGQRAARLARRIGAPRTPLRALLLGMLWGWAPCALVYAALPLALVSGSALGGAVVMLAFGAGTLPALAGAGWVIGRFARPTWRPWIGGAIVLLAIASAAQALLPMHVLPAFLCAPLASAAA